jgi:hypothetical protein
MPIPPPDVPVWKRLRKRDIDELDEASNTTHVPKRWHLPVKWHLAHTGCFPAARPGSQYAHGGRVGKLREHFMADRNMIADTRFASGFGEFLLRGLDLNQRLFGREPGDGPYKKGT